MLGERWIVSMLFLHASLLVVYKCQEGPDDVLFLNPPEVPVSRYSLPVLYSCSESAVVYLEAQISFGTGDTSTVFRRHWACDPGPPRTRVVSLRLPDWLVYQPDWAIQASDWVLSCTLRAWVSANGPGEGPSSALANAMVPLRVQLPLDRPLKKHQLCPNWASELLWTISRATIPQCPKEQEVVHFLSTVYASTGESFGITKTLQSYGNRMLEKSRLKSSSQPWCAFSLWLFLVQPCRQTLCGLLHHIDTQENYATPALFLTNKGQVHVQVHGPSGMSSAFLSHFKLPLAQWCRISLELKGQTGKVSMACDDGQQFVIHRSEHRFRVPLQLDDTEGYFVVGGSKYTRGIEGYYGPTVYYRTRGLAASEPLIHVPVRILNLTRWFQSCQDFKSELDLKISRYTQIATQKRQSEGCVDVYTRLALQSDSAFRSQCEAWQAPSSPRRRYVTRLMELLAHKHGVVDPAFLGRTLYSLVLRKLGQASGPGHIGRLMPALQQAGCLGDERGLHLASVLYSSGLGVKRQPDKAWLLSLMAAQRDWRLALMRMGHLHHQDSLGEPPDSDLAYAYYANIAKQSDTDRHTPSPQQTYVEAIYLNNEEMLKAQTNENGDLFHWLKLQARKGIVGAEQAVGRMLFWGQQGVKPDIQTAVRHYERGAVKLQDPSSMYDYGIVLLLGQGVPKDVPKALTFLRRAMDEGFVPAITALGWYYEQFERNYERAVELWEKADALGSPDAAANLGVIHSQGRYPGRPADQFKAYTYYLKSAQNGGIKGALELADTWNRGIPGRVERLPLNAVLWAKWVSEQNGYLGAVLRNGLNAYLKGDWLMALLHYIMAAESGFAAAQFNVAYLCEQNPGGFLDPAFVTQCKSRYYSLSIQHSSPDPYALIKMGDLLYDEHALGTRDVSSSAEMYKRAALRNNPQAWYSLGLLVQEGKTLPLSVLVTLDLLQSHLSGRHHLLTTLFRRCRDSNSTEAYLPCSLALFKAHLEFYQEAGGTTVRLSGVLAVAVATLPILIIIPSLLRRRTVSRGQGP